MVKKLNQYPVCAHCSTTDVLYEIVIGVIKFYLCTECKQTLQDDLND